VFGIKTNVISTVVRSNWLYFKIYIREAHKCIKILTNQNSKMYCQKKKKTINIEYNSDIENIIFYTNIKWNK